MSNTPTDSEFDKKLSEYSWDSWSVGWGDDEKHRRQLVLIQQGKVVFREVLVDGEFCQCEPYRHGWPTVESCIETWAKIHIAKRETKDLYRGDKK